MLGGDFVQFPAFTWGEILQLRLERLAYENSVYNKQENFL